MKGNFVYPLQIVVNYWETRPSQMGAHLDELLRRGVTHISSFVPWQAAESDITHMLTRFLQAACERQMQVSLIVTPELGIHYPNSGLPKDLLAKTENSAHTKSGKPVPVPLPPNAFNLPSLFSADLTKRFQAFLTRIDNLLSGMQKTQNTSLHNVTICFGGSFWKYYRAPRFAALDAFGDSAGDHSSSAALAYRKHLDGFYLQREFATKEQRWKTRAMEPVNYLRFLQLSEETFRARSKQMIRKSQVASRELEIFAPEADPATAYASFAEALTGTSASFSTLSKLVDECAARGAGGAQAIPPVIHWSALGSFHGLTDAEKQFLILKSLLVAGGQGGAVYVTEREWFALSSAFRARVELFARSIDEGEIQLASRVLYLAPHLWSGCEEIWKDILGKLGPEARLIASADRLAAHPEASLVVVDPATMISSEVARKLCEWARAGRTVVLPKSSLYTDAAIEELGAATQQSRSMEIDLGLQYKVHMIPGDGKIVVYEIPTRENVTQAWQTFMTAILSVAGVETHCRVSDPRVNAFVLDRRGGDRAVFLLNEATDPVSADLTFASEVRVSDLAVSLGRSAPLPAADSASRFALQVPPCGILALSAQGSTSTQGLRPELRREQPRPGDETDSGEMQWN